MGHKVKQSLMSSRIDFFYYAFRNILLVSIPLLIVSSVVLSHLSFHSSAEANNKSTVSSSSSDNISFTLSTSCTISGEIISAHTASLNGGQLVEDIGNTKMNAYCNDNNGYSIYAIGNSGDIDGNTDLISSISDSYNVKTGVYDSSTASSLTPSSWAMKLTAGIGTGSNPTVPTIENGYDSYKEVPDIYILVAKRTSKTDMSLDTTLSGSYINTTYQIYASSIQPAGTYSGKVKYVMVHPNSNDNHLGFNEVYALHNKTPITTENGTYYTMQDMDTTICNQVGIYDEVSQTQLLDTRDNKLYWVTKLRDGHCWMTSNLDLDIGGTNTAPLNSNNTDISTDPNVYASTGIYSDYNVSDGVYTWNPVSTAVTSNYYISGISVKPSAWPTNNYTTPYSAEGGDTYYYTSNTTGNDTRYDSLQDCKNASHTEDECKRYFAGNYYNWTAAIASNNSTNIGSTVGEIASNSICPKGWRLPNASQTDNINNEFGRMLYQAEITAKVSAGNDSVGYATGGFNKLRSNPYYFVRSGNINGNSLYYPGANSGYWSSTVSNNTDAYHLYFNNTGIYPARNDFGKFRGWSIRCIVR